ncbi:condensin-2 complex subunit H2 [Thalassophryne amazonica]|uniref:condensin-2 complex subunit H2 n=1 Tax=Thalassophryne amazonica TaxID=390379 RepID=UPI0014725F55|nr:condensin-2 complex subunit H2 [Thalassophryne amazonica]
MESVESRFAHLLQPIRELTKNWDVDVASELNDYLEELDEMCITFDGGKTRLNFAEAALLIQGSACIYSKKVELLHSLVYQTLDYINDRNKKKNKLTECQEGDGDTAAGSHEDDDDSATFTTMDCTISENKHKVLSGTCVNVAPLPPESLLPPESFEKQKFPLISVKGDILCSLKDFRINLFLPGEEDFILLTLKSSCSTLLQGYRPAAEFQQQDFEFRQLEEPAVGGADIDDAQDAAEENLAPVEDVGMEQEPEEHVERHEAPREGRMVRERQQVELDRVREEEPTHTASAWTLLDPYAVAGEDKPLKPGKCYKVPDGLDEGGKRKRKRASKLQDFRTWFSGTFDPPEPKLKNGPTFTDLNYIYLSNMKCKMSARRRIFRRAGVIVSDEELRQTFLQREEAEPMEEFGHLDQNENDNSDNEPELCPNIPEEFGAAPDFISPDTRTEDMTYENLVKLRVEQLVLNSRGYTQETALSRRVKDWEDQIRPELALQEERPPFDIHDYGDRIVAALSSVGRRRTFAAIVHSLDNFEACKYLLASLQLANDYTVEIDSAKGLEDAVDSMGLTLLSTHRATDRFKTLHTSS